MNENTYLPNMQDLSSQFGAWNPMTYLQASDNQDLARQFRDQSYQNAQINNRKGILDNELNTAKNPLEVDRMALANEGQGYKNRTGKLEAERGEANQQNVLSADQRAAALKMSDDDMKAFDYHVSDLLRSPDPAQRKEGATLQTYLSSYQLERRKAADDLLKTQTTAEAYKYRADNSLEGIKYRTDNQKLKGTLSFEQQLAKMKAADSLPQLNKVLKTGIDPDTGNELSPMARKGYQAMYDQAATQTDAAIAARANAGSMVLTPGQEGKTTLAPKQVPSVVPNKAPPKLSDQDLINQYLNKK